MAGTVRCSKGHENNEGDNFCRLCGERISGGQIRCQNCGATIDSGSHFCGKCGKPVAGGEPAPIEGMLWQRGADDFATRVDADDLPGILKKGIIVEQGTKALLFINGALAETLQPGRYDLGGLASKLKNFDPFRTGTAILVDSGDTEFQFTINDIYTKDPLKIDVTCKVVVQIENPVFFFNNVMKGRKNYLISEIRGALYDELQNAFNEAVGKKSVTELNWDLALKRQFEVQVENHLKATFQRNGFTFIQLRTIDYRFQAYDKIKGIYEETYLMVSEDEAKLQRRKRLFDVFDQDQIQDIIEEAKEVEYRSKRNKVWADMRQLVNSDRMNEVRSADDLEAFIHEIDKGKMLRAEEVESLKNSFAQGGMRRDFLLRKIELEQGLEEERIKMVGSAQNELEEWEVRAKKARKELDEKIRSQKDIKAAEIDLMIDEAKAKEIIVDIERKGDEKDMELGLRGLREVKKIKAEEERERMNMEIEKVERLSKLGIEAMIHASGPEQATILADLKKTEILKGMTDEQILAMGAKDSPELARAFQEKFKNLSTEQMEKLYKEMMTQKDQAMKMIQEMFNKSLETQRDVSVAASRGVPPNVVYPPPGQPGYYGPPGGIAVGAGGAAAEVVICTKCNSRVPVGQQFCSNCGNQMYK